MKVTAQGRLYLDHAATSCPKPREVLEAMIAYATEIGASAGRGGYAEARAAGEVIHDCRKKLNRLFNGAGPERFVFTMNCTDALNMAILGMLKPGDHAIASAMDHNSVLRPLQALKDAGVIDTTVVEVDPVTCLVDPAGVRRAMRPNTKLVALGHASNVTGTVQHIGEIGAVTRACGVALLVDAAQSAGHVPIDVQAEGIDLLAFPGHKGLLGPLGTGGLYIRPGLEKQMRPLRFGGTGSNSELPVQPEIMPDKFESGSHNAIGIAGLSAGLDWVLRKTVAAIYAHDRALCACFIEEIEGVEGLRFFGPQGVRERIGVFSVRIGEWEPVALADRLESEFGLLTRAGLHCAPLAHQRLGTSPLCEPKPAVSGTTRLSFGPFVEMAEVKYAADALSMIALEHVAVAATR